MMRKIIVLFLLIILAACSQGTTAYHDTEGKVYDSQSFQGKWLIINYWAPWCPGCVKEIPELNRFYQHLPANVLLLGVNYDHTPMPDLKEWVRKELIAYPVLIEDPKNQFQLADADVLPVTFIINPQGKVVKSIAGPNTEKSLLETLKALQKTNETPAA